MMDVEAVVLTVTLVLIVEIAIALWKRRKHLGDGDE